MAAVTICSDFGAPKTKSATVSTLSLHDALPIWETVETVSDFIFWTRKLLKMVIAAMKLKDVYSLEGKIGRAHV